VYGKGAWVFHMLREMLREPGKNPDARFIGLLHTLQTKYAYRALSTNDLQHEIEAVMTPAMGIESRHSMEWFFADWVRGTGVPHYRAEYSVKRSETGFVIKGKLPPQLQFLRRAGAHLFQQWRLPVASSREAAKRRSTRRSRGEIADRSADDLLCR
jgi:aminopeptidase N